MSHGAEELFARIAFLFDEDDGSLPEIRLTGLTAEQVARTFLRVRALSSQLNNGASFWHHPTNRDEPIDSVPNAAALVVGGDSPSFHFLLIAPSTGGVVLPDLGICVSSDEIALDYRMGRAWGPAQVSAFCDLLCELNKDAPGSRLELEELAPDHYRESFRSAIAWFGGRRRAG